MSIGEITRTRNPRRAWKPNFSLTLLSALEKFNSRRISKKFRDVQWIKFLTKKKPKHNWLSCCPPNFGRRLTARRSGIAYLKLGNTFWELESRKPLTRLKDSTLFILVFDRYQFCQEFARFSSFKQKTLSNRWFPQNGGVGSLSPLFIYLSGSFLSSNPVRSNPWSNKLQYFFALAPLRVATMHFFTLNLCERSTRASSTLMS